MLSYLVSDANITKLVLGRMYVVSITLPSMSARVQIEDTPHPVIMTWIKKFQGWQDGSTYQSVQPKAIHHSIFNTLLRPGLCLFVFGLEDSHGQIQNINRLD